ncbi:MAG: thermonuclease family protein [Bacilli bacterium]|jgi:micrococcal nuclease|nr:thermonuclease family protein [Bacilli bacterium]
MKKYNIGYHVMSIVIVILIICGIVYYLYDKLIVNSDNKTSTNNQIKLVKCIDGDTAYFTKLNKTRFLFIDTPEIYPESEPYGKEAANYTCNLLKKAKVITYEYDGNKKDNYNRSLAWIFVDDELLQEKIAQAGYVKAYYDYGNYKYENIIRKSLNDKYNIFEGER